jgi:hypothetical protein
MKKNNNAPFGISDLFISSPSTDKVLLGDTLRDILVIWVGENETALRVPIEVHLALGGDKKFRAAALCRVFKFVYVADSLSDLCKSTAEMVDDAIDMLRSANAGALPSKFLLALQEDPINQDSPEERWAEYLRCKNEPETSRVSVTRNLDSTLN